MENLQNQNIDDDMDINNLDNVVFSENNYIADNVEVNDNSDNDLEDTGLFKIDNQLFLKAILFSMVYYIISTPLLKIELKKVSHRLLIFIFFKHYYLVVYFILLVYIYK